jgi:hypothetical protein
MHSQCLRFIRVWFVTSMFDQDKKPCSVTSLRPRNQDIIMVYEALITVDIYSVGLANTRAQL